MMHSLFASPPTLSLGHALPNGCSFIVHLPRQTPCGDIKCHQEFPLNSFLISYLGKVLVCNSELGQPNAANKCTLFSPHGVLWNAGKFMRCRSISDSQALKESSETSTELVTKSGFLMVLMYWTLLVGWRQTTHMHEEKKKWHHVLNKEKVYIYILQGKTYTRSDHLESAPWKLEWYHSVQIWNIMDLDAIMPWWWWW